jgi:hypothetical protein
VLSPACTGFDSAELTGVVEWRHQVAPDRRDDPILAGVGIKL